MTLTKTIQEEIEEVLLKHARNNDIGIFINTSIKHASSSLEATHDDEFVIKVDIDIIDHIDIINHG